MKEILPSPPLFSISKICRFYSTYQKFRLKKFFTVSNIIFSRAQWNPWKKEEARGEEKRGPLPARRYTRNSETIDASSHPRPPSSFFHLSPTLLVPWLPYKEEEERRGFSLLFLFSRASPLTAAIASVGWRRWFVVEEVTASRTRVSRFRKSYVRATLSTSASLQPSLVPFSKGGGGGRECKMNRSYRRYRFEEYI